MDSTHKIDLCKDHPEVYKARETPDVVEVGVGRYLTFSGQGAPEGPAFGEAVGGLYSVAYTLKFMHKAQGRDFKVAPLEASWWTDGPRRFDTVPREQWRWKARIRVPLFVAAEDLEGARRQLADKGKEGAFGSVRLETLDDGACVRVLHVGPYADEQPTIEAMHAFAVEQGFELAGRHHEVYLSDPRRTKPERLRTVLRHPVRPGGDKP